MGLFELWIPLDTSDKSWHNCEKGRRNQFWPGFFPPAGHLSQQSSFSGQHRKYTYHWVCYRNIKIKSGIHEFEVERQKFLDTEMSICHLILNMLLSDMICYTLQRFRCELNLSRNVFVERDILKRLGLGERRKRLNCCTAVEKFFARLVLQQAGTTCTKLQSGFGGFF